MLILRTKGDGHGLKYHSVAQNEDDTLTITRADGKPHNHPGLLIYSHGGVLGTLMRCIEFDGTIGEYLASTTAKQRGIQWASVDKRWHEFLEYQKSLPVIPATEQIFS